MTATETETMPELIDLRSDTVTQPTPGMRQAIARAEVADDCYGEDPTVNRLEAQCAELLGKPAAVFTPSGTMANQVAIRAQTEHGQEIVVEALAHIYNYERAALAALSGVQVMPVPGERGIMKPEDAARAIRAPFSVHPHTALVCLEITSNRGAGSIYPLETVRQIAAIARERNVGMHLDGARLLNACVALGVEPIEFTQHFDSVTLCFSKGLGAPVGSVIAGDEAFIGRCRYFRGQFGGAMRQAGILAAAAIYALDHNVLRMAEDHAHATLLGDVLAELPGVEVMPIETNMVIFTVPDAAATVEALRGEGVLVGAIGKTQIRAVTNLNITRPMMDRAVEAFRKVLVPASRD